MKEPTKKKCACQPNLGKLRDAGRALVSADGVRQTPQYPLPGAEELSKQVKGAREAACELGVCADAGVVAHKVVDGDADGDGGAQNEGDGQQEAPWDPTGLGVARHVPKRAGGLCNEERCATAGLWWTQGGGGGLGLATPSVCR